MLVARRKELVRRVPRAMVSCHMELGIPGSWVEVGFVRPACLALRSHEERARILLCYPAAARNLPGPAGHIPRGLLTGDHTR